MRSALHGITRREWLGLIGVAAWPSLMTAASARSTRAIASTEPLVRIHDGGPSGLLGIGRSGTLWALSLTGDAPRRLAEGIDATTPLASGHGRVAARTVDGDLWVASDGRVSITRDVHLAVHAGLLILPFAMLGVVSDGPVWRLVRFAPDGADWREAARLADPVLPDARPIRVAFDGSSNDDGHLVVLAGPDTMRYDHGILGDAIEATRMLWVERHGLEVLREVALPAPYVFEDIAPRPVRLERGQGVLTMRSGGSGTRLALVGADAGHDGRLRIAALGDPVGGPQRWLAPTPDGRHWLAVHTPHLAGVLDEYRLDGDRLVSRVIATDVANHRIGTRELDLGVWIGSTLVLPSQDGRRLRSFEATRKWTEGEAIELPARVVASTRLGTSSDFVVLLEDGSALQNSR